MTEGLHYGASKEVGDIFQEDLKRSEMSEIDDHASIPLIGVVPWGIVADSKNLQGINVSTDLQNNTKCSSCLLEKYAVTVCWFCAAEHNRER